ncbi:hypothetical protein [Roseomonas sp. BN140053]|uniref:hypothetical protein n=1 Tax=Roseomonas sp. BN140053 TaxID=3391898 RepID=UPI0039E7B77C
MKGLLTRILDVLRGAWGSLTGGWDWLGHRWNAMAATPFGRACGQAWTWGAKVPAQVVLSPFWIPIMTAKDKGRIRPVADRCAAAVRRGYEGVVGAAAGPARSAASAAISLPGAAVRGAASLPLRAVRSVLEAVRPRPAVAAPAQAAAEAARRAQEHEQKADAAADNRVLLNSFRKVVAARARGARPPEDSLDALPPSLAVYALGLEPGECEALAVARTAVLRILLETGVAPDGVRSPRQVAEDRAEVESNFRSSEGERASRRAEVRAALRRGRARDLGAEPLTA